MTYEQAITILERVKAGDLSPTLAQITEALVLTGDCDGTRRFNQENRMTDEKRHEIMRRQAEGMRVMSNEEMARRQLESAGLGAKPGVQAT